MADETPDWQEIAKPAKEIDFEGEAIHERALDSTERSHRAIDAIVAELRKLARLVDRGW